MDARPARTAGHTVAEADASILHTTVFATNDVPPADGPGGSDDDHTPAAPARQGPTASGAVCGRPRPSGPPPSRDATANRRREFYSVRQPASGWSRTASCGTPRSDDENASDTLSHEPATAPAWVAVSRGVAGFLGAFTLLNVLGEMRHAGFDANLWWIDLRPLPAAAVRAWLTLAGLLFVAFAVRPPGSTWRNVTTAITALLLAASLWNTLSYYDLLRRGAIHRGPAVPFSLHASVCLVVILAGLRSAPGQSARRGNLLVGAVAFAACLIAFPLAQMHCDGQTDYRRAADAVVVFGCQVHADGTPSQAMAERVATACRLHRDGLVKRIILSGGAGLGRTHECEAMRQLALESGVPASAIDLDAQGVSTAASVRNTVQRFREHPGDVILAISHSYHLPRVRLWYRRAGREVYTVPAVAERPPERRGWHLVREVAALWWDYVRPLAAT